MSSCRAVLGALACLAGTSASADLRFVDVDAPRAVASLAMVLTPSDQPAFAYGDDGLYYRSWDGSDFVLEVVDPDVCGPDVSLAVDGVGSPSIAYDKYGALWVARHDGSSWLLEEVDAAGSAGSGSSITVDAAGNPAVSYYEAFGRDLRVARFDGAAWSVETVAASGDVGGHSSIVFDPGGRLAVAYWDASDGTIRLARDTGGSWSDQMVAEGNGHCDLAFDGSGRPAVAYWMGIANESRLARTDGSSWQVETVAGFGGQWLSLAFDGAGDPAVVHIDRRAPADPRVLVARKLGLTWGSEDVGSGGFETSVAFAASGEPVVSWLDSVQSVQLARRAGAAWSVEEIERTDRVADHAALAFDRAGFPVIAYDSSFGLRLARWDGAAFTLATIDDRRGAGSFVSLALGDGARPMIAYWNSGMPALYFAEPDGSGGWTIDVVDGAGPENRGTFASLTLDAAGEPCTGAPASGASRS